MFIVIFGLTSRSTVFDVFIITTPEELIKEISERAQNLEINCAFSTAICFSSTEFEPSTEQGQVKLFGDPR